MSRTKQLAMSSLSILGAQGANMLISVLFLAYFARVFSKEQMAMYAIATALSQWNLFLGGLGMGTIMEKDTPALEAKGDLEEVKRFIASATFYRFITTALLSVLWLALYDVVGRRLFGGEYEKYVYAFGFIVIFGWFRSIFTLLQQVQVALQRFPRKAAISTITQLIQRVLCVVGFLVYGFYGFYAGFLLATLFGITLAAWDVRKYLTFKLIPFWKLLGHSKSYLVLSVMGGALKYVDQPVIGLCLGADALAGYFIAKRLYDNLYGLLRATIGPMAMKYAEVKVQGKKILQSYHRRSLAVSFCLFIPMGFYIMVVAKPVLLLYGGEKYESVSPILMAFGFVLICVACWDLFRGAGLRLIRARHLMYQYVASAVVTVVSYVILLPWLGAIGIPIAMGVGYLAGLLPILYQLKKKWGLSIPSNILVRSLLCGVGVLCVGAIVPKHSNPIVAVSLATVLTSVFCLLWICFVGPVEVSVLLKRAYAKLPLVGKRN